MNRPKLSVIIVIYNMRREAPRTIYSALSPFQKDVDPAIYEVLILENGSSEPLPPNYVANLPSNVRYLPVPDATPSPAPAMNWGAAQANGEVLMFCIDGARMLSDRLISLSLREVELRPDAFVYTLGWHLGPDVQMSSCKKGYDRAVEDKLLEEANWSLNSSKLIEISVPAGSSARGPFGRIYESNAFTVTRALFETVGGYDERFTMPGGSMCNLEIFRRYMTRENSLNVQLLSEGTFHQFHGGAATSGQFTAEQRRKDYLAIFGRHYDLPPYETEYVGQVRPEALEKFPDLFMRPPCETSIRSRFE